MKKLSFCVLLLSTLPYLHAQEGSILWQKEIPSARQDFLAGLTLTIDRQMLLSGSSIQTPKPQADGRLKNNGYDYHIVKLDQQGNKLWDRYYGGNRHDYLVSSVSTQEGGFLLAGTSYSAQGSDKKKHSLGGADLWILKLDENGEEQWQKTLGTSRNDQASAAVQSADLGFFVAGNTAGLSQEFGTTDTFVVKLDKAGNSTAQILLGGSGRNELQKMIPTRDGGVLLGLYSTSGIVKPDQEPLAAFLPVAEEKQTHVFSVFKSEDSYGEGDYWVVKLDKEGKLQWQRSFGGTGEDRIKTLSFFERGYLIGGESRSGVSGNKQMALKQNTDLWLVALNEQGDELWQKSYSFGAYDVLMSQNTITAVNGNTKGFLLGGYTQAGEKAAKTDETFWMLYLDPEGKEVWRKHVEGKNKQKEERLVEARLQSDGSYLLAGTTAMQLGEEKWKVLKVGDKDLEQLIEKQDIRIYPNPVQDYAYVEIGFDFKEAELRVFDMSGRMVYQTKTNTKVTKINTGALPQGVYVATAETHEKTVNSKIVKR